MIKVLLLLFFTVFTSNVLGMDFDRLGGTFTMHGEIKKDDSLRFIAELVSWETPPTVFYITSKGGNLEEAMRIGKIIRESQIPVWSGEECYSACVFIYASGVEREAQGNIGLHRPDFDKEYFKNLSSVEAKNKYESLKMKSIQYLKEIEVSQGIIERMFHTGSTDIDIIEAGEANKIFGVRAPFYEEWLTAKCGKLTNEQLLVLESWNSLLAARETIRLAKDDITPKTESYGSNLQELVEHSQLAAQLAENGLLKEYIDLFHKHRKCTDKAVNDHVFSFHKALRSHFVNY